MNKKTILVVLVFVLSCGTLPQEVYNRTIEGAVPPPMTTSEPMETNEPLRFTVCAETLNLREFAGTSAPVITTLSYGEMVTGTGRTETPDIALWREVTTDYGVRGWVNGAFLCVM